MSTKPTDILHAVRELAQTDAQRLYEIAEVIETDGSCKHYAQFLRSLADRLSRPCAEGELRQRDLLKQMERCFQFLTTHTNYAEAQAGLNACRAYASVLRAKEEGWGVGMSVLAPMAGDRFAANGRTILVVGTSRHRISYTYDDVPSSEVYRMLRSAWVRYATKEDWRPQP